MAVSFGWDLGGANLKLARIEDSRVSDVRQIPCPIMSDRVKFDAALGQALDLCSPGARHAVTMTGELSDVFADRAEGVGYLVELMRKAAGHQTLFYGIGKGFLPPDEAVTEWQTVASANWHASAALAAMIYPEGLFVDIGTTTTDLIPFIGGQPATRGATDGERLTEWELVYTGVVRTPVMAIAHEAPFRGRMQGVAAERFATMADVYRLTGQLPEDADPHPTADQRDKGVEASAARLARMLGRDRVEADLAEWVGLACNLAGCQMTKIEAAARVLLEREGLGASAPVIGAGCGRFLAKDLANRLGRPYRDFAEAIECAAEAREMAARCAPAVAVALLAAAIRR